MKKNVLTGLFAFAACILLVLCVLVQLLSDKKGPVIRFSGEEITYGEGQDETVLLQGVEAVDNRDGNVPVYVEGIYSLENNRVKVYYAAADRAGNVSKASRVVNYGSGEAQEPGTETLPNDPESPPTEPEAAKPSGGTDTEPPSEEESTKSSEALPNSGPEVPVITLKSSKAELERGARFQYSKYIKEITDDKDDSDTLFRRINISGTYDVNVPGTYEITYIVFDTDGHKSAPAKLTLVVK